MKLFGIVALIAGPLLIVASKTLAELYMEMIGGWFSTFGRTTEARKKDLKIWRGLIVTVGLGMVVWGVFVVAGGRTAWD